MKHLRQYTKLIIILVTAVFISSCTKQVPLNHISARSYFVGQANCLEVLMINLKAAECPKLKYHYLANNDIMIRCFKNDEDRSEFWDNYIFRISPAETIYLAEKSKKLIKDHTLCIDNALRIEAYPPNHSSEN